MVESSGGDYATTMIFNNDVPHQPMNFDHMPHHEGYRVACSHVIFSFFLGWAKNSNQTKLTQTNPKFMSKPFDSRFYQPKYIDLVWF